VLHYIQLQSVVITSLFWDVKRRRFLVIYRRCGTAYRPKMGPTGCGEASINDYKSTLCNTPEEQRSRLHRGGSHEITEVSRIHLGKGQAFSHPP
jgi:hypothetical protein